MLQKLVPAVALMLVWSVSPASGGETPRGDAGWKNLFWLGLATTVGTLIGTTFAVSRVHDREDQRVAALEDLREADPNNNIFMAENACAAAEADSS